MGIWNQFIFALHDIPLAWAVFAAVAGNVSIFVLALAVGHWLVKRYNLHRIVSVPDPISREEYFLAGLCVLMNGVVAIVGIVLWRAGVLQVRQDIDWRVLVDTVVLITGMDFLMYVFHRVAHLPILFPLVHRTHHRYENPRPLTLFVLNPLEVLGFGGLLIVLLWLYPSSVEGILIYLALNMIFGMIGHLGVEPFPRLWTRWSLTRLISTSTFHAEHHQDKGHNFGFYTLIWDRLFGTLSPDYVAEFESAATYRPGHESH